jgi:polyisoprenoid-binding protein YceI
MRIPMLTAILMALSVNPAWAEPREFKIDTEHFSIGFAVDHVGYADQLGLFLKAEGHFVYDEDANELHEGEVIVKADSVFTNHERRDDHLRNEDFLHADRYDTIRFVADRWAPEDDRSGTLHGKLTLLGETRPVELEVTINKTGDYPFGHRAYTMGLSAKTSIRRSEWGMTYAIDDGLVGDEVHLSFELEALAQ